MLPFLLGDPASPGLHLPILEQRGRRDYYDRSIILRFAIRFRKTPKFTSITFRGILILWHNQKMATAFAAVKKKV